MGLRLLLVVGACCDAYRLPSVRSVLRKQHSNAAFRSGNTALRSSGGGGAPAPSPAKLWGVTAAAVVGIGSSAVLARGVSGAVAPQAIAFWRMAGSTALLACAPAVRRGLGAMEPRDLRRAVAAGFFLALHFQLFFLSLARTTILRSTVLVTLVPLWVGVADRFLLGNAVAPRFWPGVALAIAGATLMARSANPVAAALPPCVSGDALAVGAGVAWAANMLLSRDARARVAAPTWQAAVCLSAAALLLASALASGVALAGFGARASALLLAFVLGPQLVGHQGLDYVIKWLPAPTVASLTLLEPVVASVLAALFLGELPSRTAALGGLVATMGVGFAL